MAIQTRRDALQNEIVRLYCEFSSNGVLSNPLGQPLVEIIDADGVTVLATVPAAIENTGIMYADWYVPADLPLGTYYDRWTFQWTAASSVTELTFDFQVHNIESYINFVSPAISHKISNRAAQLMTDLSNEFIYEAMHIPVYFEQAMRIQQENQQTRNKTYYYFTLDSDTYSLSAEDVYFGSGQKFVVWQDLSPLYSSSSSSQESEGNTSSSSSSSSSIDSSSSSSSSSSQSSSSSSESAGNDSSSSSSEVVTTTTTTTEWAYKPILTAVGTGDPSPSGTLVKVSGTGPDTITYISYSKGTSYFSTIYSLAYQNWNREPKPIVRLNSRKVDDGWYVDYNGRIFFDRLMAPEDSVNVAYNFAYFSEEEILSFLKLGLQMMNATPPASWTYPNFDTMPMEWDAAVILWAAITAIRRLIFGLNWQEKAIIFGRPDDFARTQQVIANFQALLSDYLTIWKETAENLKKRLPPTYLYVTPEYTLPGGRCMSADTYIKCLVDDSFMELTIEDLYGLFENGKDLKVLAMKDRVLDYFEVSKIWSSGSKLTYKISDGINSIRLSEEHMVFMPEENIYRPVKYLGVEKILVLNNGDLLEAVMVSPPVPYSVEKVFDIEVPEAENFIGNNIVSHNSRWFRYLFKTGS